MAETHLFHFQEKDGTPQRIAKRGFMTVVMTAEADDTIVVEDIAFFIPHANIVFPAEQPFSGSGRQDLEDDGASRVIANNAIREMRRVGTQPEVVRIGA